VLQAFYCHGEGQVRQGGLLLNSKKLREVVLPNRYSEALQIGKASLDSPALTTSAVKIACESWVAKGKQDHEVYVATRPGSAPTTIGLLQLDSELTGLNVAREWEEILCICRSPDRELAKEKDGFFLQFLERSTR
jgi:hypothetical protein